MLMRLYATISETKPTPIQVDNWKHTDVSYENTSTHLIWEGKWYDVKEWHPSNCEPQNILVQMSDIIQLDVLYYG